MRRALLLFCIVFCCSHVRSQDTTITAGDSSLSSVITKRQKKPRSERPPSKLYFKLYSGYGFFTPGSFRVNSSFALHDTTIKTQSKRGLGNGFRVGGGFGLVMNYFLDLGIDVEYVKGSWSETPLDQHTNALNYNTRKSGMDYSIISITPNVIFKALAKPKYFVYNKLGIVGTLPFTLSVKSEAEYGSNVVLENNLNLFNESVQSTTTVDYKIPLSVGVNVALGFNMKMSNKLRLFGEIFGNYSALSPTSSVQTDHTTRSATLTFISANTEPLVVKQISTVTTYTTYKKGESLPLNGTYTSKPPEIINDYTVTNATINTLAHNFTINMAAVGVSIGIIYRF